MLLKGITRLSSGLVLSSLSVLALTGCYSSPRQDYSEADFLKELERAESRKIVATQPAPKTSFKKIDSSEDNSNSDETSRAYLKPLSNQYLSSSEPESLESYSGYQKSPFYSGLVSGLEERMDELSFPFKVKISGIGGFDFGWYADDPRDYFKFNLRGGDFYIRKELTSSDIQKLIGLFGGIKTEFEKIGETTALSD